MLSANPSKAEEIAHYNKFVNELPKESYLYSMLIGTTATVTNNIRNDFACDPLETIWKQQREAIAENARVTAESEAVQRKINGMKQEESRLQAGMDNLRRLASRIAEGS